MIAISRRKQWWFVGFAYLAVALCSAELVYDRYKMYAANPQDSAAASGMYAAGDEMLILFICFLFLVPTVFFLHLLSTYEKSYEVYSQFLFAVSLTAPLCLAWLFAGEYFKTQLLEGMSLMRIFRSPLILILIGLSRWMAPTRLTKRLMNYSMLAEAGALALAVVSLFVSSKIRG